MEEFLFEESLMDSMEIVSFEERDISQIVRENAHALLDAQMDMMEICDDNEFVMESQGPVSFIENIFRKIKELLIRFKNWLVSLFKKEEAVEKKKEEGNKKSQTISKNSVKDLERNKKEENHKKAMEEISRIEIPLTACKIDMPYMTDRLMIDKVISALESDNVELAKSLIEHEKTLKVQKHLLFDSKLTATDFKISSFPATINTIIVRYISSYKSSLIGPVSLLLERLDFKREECEVAISRSEKFKSNTEYTKILMDACIIMHQNVNMMVSTIQTARKELCAAISNFQDKVTDIRNKYDIK